MAVTRTEIAAHLRDAFDGTTPLTSIDLIAEARNSGARPAILHTLEALPGTYSDLRQLWPDLPGVPIDR